MEPDALDLDVLAEANGFSEWMFSRCRPLVRGRVAEVGAGIGTYSSRLLGAGADELLLLEPEAGCRARLQSRFGDDPRVRISGDALPDSPELRRWAASCDLVLCQNVLEHVADDHAAVGAMCAALRPGGRLALVVPAHPGLFNRLDRRYGHHRRYTKSRLRSLAAAFGLEIELLQRFNALGVAGWMAQVIRRRPGIGPGALRAYEWMLRPWRGLEDRLPMPLGLSLIMHARRP